MGDEFAKFKAAAIQASPVFLDRDGTIEKACCLIEEAGQNGAELIVFPETFVPTYPCWPLLGADYRKIRQAFVKLFQNAVEIPSPATDALRHAAKKAGAYVVIGINERDAQSKGSLYNTLLYVGKDGQLLGKHRKLVPTSYERLVWGRGDGSGLKVFDTAVGRLGGLICYEHHMPLAKYALFSKGEQVHVAVWPQMSSINHIVDAACRQYAFEGQTFVVVAGAIMTNGTIPSDFALKAETKVDYNGGSAIVDPSGKYLAGPLYGEEGILYANIDLSRIVEQKYIIDSVGHYARPDVLTLLVDESENLPTQTTKRPEVTIEELREQLEDLAFRFEGEEGELRKALRELVGKVKN